MLSVSSVKALKNYASDVGVNLRYSARKAYILETKYMHGDSISAPETNLFVVPCARFVFSNISRKKILNVLNKFFGTKIDVLEPNLNINEIIKKIHEFKRGSLKNNKIPKFTRSIEW